MSVRSRALKLCRLQRLRARCLSTSTSSTINEAEISHFSRLSSQWWSETGEFGLLHKMNPVRVQFIREKILESRYDDGSSSSRASSLSESNLLNNMEVLDVGCGGGLLSESLARLGANTLGLDASESNIAIASLHASQDPALRIQVSPQESIDLPRRSGTLAYKHGSVEELTSESKRFDVVCSMEVLEHVDNPAGFLRSCAELVKPGGHLFLSTISRTPLAYLLTIFAAEQVLRLVAPGTHTYSKYIKPSELVELFSKPIADTQLTESNTQNPTPWISHLYNDVPSRKQADIRGIAYLPWKGGWSLAPRGAIGSTECNYLFWVRKPSV